VKENLIQLSRRRILNYIPKKRTPQIYFQQERLESAGLRISMQEYNARKERYRERMEAILNYAQSHNMCRSRQLLAYFGEEQPHDCGQCDVCLKRGVRNTPHVLDRLRDEILLKLEDGPLPVQALVPLFDRDPGQIRELLRWMVEQGELKYEVDGVVQRV
jgi:ATP-dependent DNA helicase RecQ